LSRYFFDRRENKGEKGGNLPLPQFLTDFNNFLEKWQVAGYSQVVVNKILIEGEVAEKGGSLPLPQFLTDFNTF